MEQSNGTSNPQNQFLLARVAVQVSISEMHSARDLLVSMARTTRCYKILQERFRVDCW